MNVCKTGHCSHQETPMDVCARQKCIPETSQTGRPLHGYPNWHEMIQITEGVNYPWRLCYKGGIYGLKRLISLTADLFLESTLTSNWKSNTHSISATLYFAYSNSFYSETSLHGHHLQRTLSSQDNWFPIWLRCFNLLGIATSFLNQRPRLCEERHLKASKNKHVCQTGM